MGESRRFARDRYSEATETLRALLQMPYRISRRRSNHAHEISVAATDLARIRHQLDLSARWIERNDASLGRAFRATLDAVETDVQPRLLEAWAHPNQTDGDWAHPSDHARGAVEAWRMCARMRFFPARLLLPAALRAHRRAVTG